MNPVHILSAHFFKIISNIIPHLRLGLTSDLFRFYNQNFVCISHLTILPHSVVIIPFFLVGRIVCFFVAKETTETFLYASPTFAWRETEENKETAYCDLLFGLIHRPYVLQPLRFEGWLFRHQVNLLWWVRSIELASIGGPCMKETAYSGSRVTRRDPNRVPSVW
jgi:hypothetical protein